MNKVIILALLCVALAGCRGRARVEAAQANATPEATPATVATVEPPPQPIQATGDIESSTMTDPALAAFAMVSAGLSFVAVCGGFIYLYASGVGRVIIRRNLHLFTPRSARHG